MDAIGPGLGNHVGVACGAVADVGRHHTSVPLHFLKCVHVEI
jgi:hypothetical protein